MKIVLLKDVAKVGRKYEVKNVADGYAINLLIPKGLAQIATPEVVKRIDLEKSRDLADKKIQMDLLLKNFEIIKNTELVFKEKANEKGHLFAGVTKEMITEELEKSTKFKLDIDSIKLNKPIKETGEHKIPIEVLGKKAEFKIYIESI